MPNRAARVGPNQDKFGLRPITAAAAAAICTNTSNSSVAGSVSGSVSATSLATSAELLDFLGRLIGTGVRHGLQMGLDLPVTVWRPLVGLPLAPQHLEAVDLLTARRLAAVRSAGEALTKRSTDASNVEVPAEFSELTMTAHLSDEREVPLITGGASEPVTLQNWSDYVALTQRTVLKEGASALAALRAGLAAVLPAEAFALFTPAELERLVCGVRSVDIELLQHCAEYEDCSADSPQVKFLWQVLREFGPTERTAFLRFVWARSRLPSSAKVRSVCVFVVQCFTPTTSLLCSGATKQQ